MKNKLLLLGATAILSTSFAMNVNAVPVSAISVYGTNVTINPTVSVLTPVNITSEEELNFGILISPKLNQQITIPLTGNVATGDATLVDNTIGVTVNRGRLLISGEDAFSIEGDKWSHWGSPYSVTFPSSVTLYNGNAECGTVTFTEGEWEQNGGDADYRPMSYEYGGTFTVTQASIPAGTCTNEATVTVILKEVPENP